MPDYKTPGVYLEEIPHLPPSISSVETAIPVFIGYTQKAIRKDPGDLENIPTRIQSMLEYEQYFGTAEIEKGIEVTIDGTHSPGIRISAAVASPSRFLLYYSLQLFFANGGLACYIVSIGDYSASTMDALKMATGLEKIAAVSEITLIVFPDALNLPDAEAYYNLHEQAIRQCASLQDRFTIMDVYRSHTDWSQDRDLLRTSMAGTPDELKFTAAYFPRLFTRIAFNYQNPATGQEEDQLVKIINRKAGKTGTSLAELRSFNPVLYAKAKAAVRDIPMLLPAAPAIAGIYTSVDSQRGVWKAPANINITQVIKSELTISQEQQEDLQIDNHSGLSINLIRSFPGRGPAIIWGARTLAGNDNEWRYVPVRRFFNMVGESIKNGTEQFVFEPNDVNTWVRIKSMIYNYLTQQWKAGALQGTTTREAFFVHVGLGETMTQQDILEGRLIVEIGMAVVRPAEFIILRFMHKMLCE